MDMKAAGVSDEIFVKALEQARQARLAILDKMDAVISAPSEMSPYAPRIITIKIPTEKIREIIGPGGRVVQGIIAETGATIDIEDDGTIYVASKDGMSGAAAKHMIEAIVKDVEPGDVYMGKVTKTTAFGAFVEIKPGREGLVHISKLAHKRIEKVEDVVHEGDRLPVRVLEIDRQNRVSLTAVDVEEPTS
jgi:polyribonucleotide nucleotidyltransferase